MFSIFERNQIIASFEEQLGENKLKNLEGTSLVKYLEAGDVPLVKAVVEKIKSNVVLALPRDIVIPNVKLHLNPKGVDAGIQYLGLRVSSLQSEPKKVAVNFDYACEGETDSSLVSKIYSDLSSAYRFLLIEGMAESNIKEINTLFGSIVEKSGVDYTITFVTPAVGGSKKKVSFISDDAITFVGDMESIFEVEDLVIFDGSDPEKISGLLERVAGELSDRVSTAGLVKDIPQIIKKVIGLKGYLKPITILKKVTGKNILTAKKDDIYFYYKDGVFALVEKANDNYRVLFGPVDDSELKSVDTDVLKDM